MKYQIWTIGGPNVGWGAAVGGQAMGVVMAIQKEGETRYANYLVTGCGAGVAKWGASLASGPSSSSDFEASVAQADKFEGTASIVDTSAQLGVSFGWSRITWLTGAAQGAVCQGWGGSVNVAIGVGGSSTAVYFKFLEWKSGKPEPGAPIPYQPPKVFKDRYGREIAE